MGVMKFGIGQPVRRVEDARFVTGAGLYTSDFAAEGVAHAVVLRSPHAHARFRIGDLSAVRAMPGVLAVLTHADVADLGDLPCQGTVKNGDGSRMKVPGYPILARDVVRHVGDAIAFIVAESVLEARDAAEAVPVTYEPLPAAVGIAGAETDAALVWPELKTNLAYDTALGDRAKTEAAFAAADRIVTLPLVNNRLVANFLETRACLAAYDPASGGWTITLGSQGSHDVRDILADDVLKVPPEAIRVVTPDVGGGFGTKIFVYREYPLCAVAARQLGRPVSWVAERGEHFVGDTQGRDNIAVAEMAMDARGRFLAMRVDLKADMGAYLSQFAPYVPFLGAGMTPGCYDIPAVHVRVRGYFSHTVPVDAYRGAGRPEAAYVVERLVDECARQAGIAPDRLRALNFVKPKQMPYRTATGRVYDSGAFEATMRRAMELGDWKGFAARARASRKAGRLRGIGLATYVEACAGGSPEEADVSLGRDGRITVLIGTQSNGQGHLTAYAQLVSQHLDVPLDLIDVIQGDTARIRTGNGTGGSRSIPVGGAAVAGAARVLGERIRELAADMLEAAPGDLEFEGGAVRVAGTDRAVALADIGAKHGGEAALTATHKWKPPEATYPNGTHCCELEIDPDTGTVEILRYAIVDDFGVTLNPLLLAGQVHGGAVQGIGQALHEWTCYDADGQLLTASFMDYRLPRADDVPGFVFETLNVPCRTNVLGMKGAGEAGAIGACPAVMNAVADALARAGIAARIDMPATPAKVHAALAARRP